MNLEEYLNKYELIDLVDNGEFIQLLVKSGKVNDIKDDNGSTPLHWACDKCNVEVVKLLIGGRGIDNGADVNMKNEYGYTPLHWACGNGNVGVVKLLIDNGADVHMRDDYGETPLHLACDGGNVDTIKLVKWAGAKY